MTKLNNKKVPAAYGVKRGAAGKKLMQLKYNNNPVMCKSSNIAGLDRRRHMARDRP